MSDTTAPVPLSASISGNKLTLLWTEAESPPVLNVPIGYPTTIHVAGAGTAQTNGDYVLASGSDSSYAGYPQYTNGPDYIFVGGGPFLLGLGPGGGSGGNSLFYGFNKGSTPNGYLFPPDGQIPQTYSMGAAPTPSVTTSGRSFTANQGLTLAGLSGGAATVSNVVTTGKATTATLSRSVAAGEIVSGSQLNGLAGAFSDSASPPNLAAAFSIPLTAAAAPVPTPPRSLTATVTQ